MSNYDVHNETSWINGLPKAIFKMSAMKNYKNPKIWHFRNTASKFLEMGNINNLITICLLLHKILKI